MQLQGIPKKSREKTAKELLARVGLGERINSRPAIAIGRTAAAGRGGACIGFKPQFVLADEPTANLDSVSTGISSTSWKT
jgi:putative ABC transport system ATP-binding protein